MRKDARIELESQIKSARAFCESEIARMTEEAEQNDKLRTYRVGAHDMHELYISFIDEGFTEEQAWELIKMVIAKA